MRPCIGIDVGNANGYVSWLYADPRDPGSEARDPIPLLPGTYAATSGVSTNVTITPDGTLSVAPGVRRNSAAGPRRRGEVLPPIKSFLHHESIPYNNNASRINTADAFAAIIKELVAIANEELTATGQKPIYDVVVALPAIFHNRQDSALILEKVRACINSIELDGHKLSLRSTIPEPAAIALDYMHYMQYGVAPSQRVNKDDFTVIVYDLGHGTFDTALVTVSKTGQPYRLLHQAGLPYGGAKMDMEIREHFIAQIRQQLEDPALVQRAENNRELQDMIPEAKHALSDAESFVQELEVGDSTVTLSLTRADFEAMIKLDVDDTIGQLEVMRQYALENNIAVDSIVLSGGCSQIPLVQRRIAQWSQSLGEQAIPVLPPYRTSKAVSFGAARYAYRQSQLERVTRYTYSVLLDNGRKLEGEMLPVISERQNLPCTSKPIQLQNQPGGEFWVCRNLDPHDPLDQAPLENRKRMMCFRVDLPANASFLATFTVNEEYLISVKCETPEHTPIPLI